MPYYKCVNEHGFELQTGALSPDDAAVELAEQYAEDWEEYPETQEVVVRDIATDETIVYTVYIEAVPQFRAERNPDAQTS